MLLLWHSRNHWYNISDDILLYYKPKHCLKPTDIRKHGVIFTYYFFGLRTLVKNDFSNPSETLSLLNSTVADGWTLLVFINPYQQCLSLPLIFILIGSLKVEKEYIGEGLTLPFHI